LDRGFWDSSMIVAKILHPSDKIAIKAGRWIGRVLGLSHSSII
jgi:hypothetical protein